MTQVAEKIDKRSWLAVARFNFCRDSFYHLGYWINSPHWFCTNRGGLCGTSPVDATTIASSIRSKLNVPVKVDEVAIYVRKADHRQHPHAFE